MAKKPSRGRARRCVITGCGCAVRSRGLCQRHYYQADYEVRKGNTSWSKLVKAGLALKPGAAAAADNPFRALAS